MTVSLKAEEDTGASIGRRKPMLGGSHLRAQESGLRRNQVPISLSWTSSL